MTAKLIKQHLTQPVEAEVEVLLDIIDLVGDPDPDPDPDPVIFFSFRCCRLQLMSSYYYFLQLQNRVYSYTLRSQPLSIPYSYYFSLFLFPKFTLESPHARVGGTGTHYPIRSYKYKYFSLFSFHFPFQ